MPGSDRFRYILVFFQICSSEPLSYRVSTDIMYTTSSTVKQVLRRMCETVKQDSSWEDLTEPLIQEHALTISKERYSP